MQRWEYLVAYFEQPSEHDTDPARQPLPLRSLNRQEVPTWPFSEGMVEELQRLGDDGWELVSAYQGASFADLIFKRPRL